MLQCLISLESCCQVTRGRPLLEGELALHSCIDSTNPMPDGTNNLQDVAQQGATKNLQEHTSKDEHYDVDIASEVLRSVSVLNPRNGETRISAITRHLSEHGFLSHRFLPPTDTISADTTIQPDTKGTAPDISPEETLTPLIPLPPHPPFPIAMVCRKPWGAPNHHCVYTAK